MKRFFNIDLHISVIADIRDVFKRIHPDIEIEDWSLSGHSWVFNKTRKQIDLLSSDNWKNIDKPFIKAFADHYRSYFEKFDGFIAAHPNSFALFYESFNKPIYVINSCRYDMPFCWTNDHSMISELNDCFKRLQNKGLLRFISNNKADNAYFKLANPWAETMIIPSLCLYTGMKWNPDEAHEKFLIYSGPEISPFVHRSSLGTYQWSTLMKFKGLIHFPYEASTMSIFEQISSGIPLFFPSKAFLKDLWNQGTIHKQMNYWGHRTPEYLKPTQDLEFWIDKADYYDIEGCYYFDSIDHLKQITENFKDTLYEVRMKFIEERYKVAINSYEKMLL